MGAVEVTEMLARTAQGLYWMSRYLERAEHTCRLLSTQFETLEDGSVEEIDENWRRIFESIARTPTGGYLSDNLDDEDFMLTDSFTLADEMTFELHNSDSIRSCINSARENARQVRNVIGLQMWTQLNKTYLELKNASIHKIWNDDPEMFYLNTGDSVRALSGIFDSTMYRDHGWHFSELGRYIERMQIVASLLLAQVQVFPSDADHSDSDWSSLLSICDSKLAYQRKHSPLAFYPREVLEFVLRNESLAHSVRFCLIEILKHLGSVSSPQMESTMNEIYAQSDLIGDYLDGNFKRDYPHDREISDLLRNILNASRSLNDSVNNVFFDYHLATAHST